MKNIAAYTPATPNNGDYVAYVSINKTGENDELVSVTVRSQGAGTPQQAEIIMPKAEFALLLVNAFKNI